MSVKVQRWASWPFPGFLPACLKRTWLRVLGNVCAEYWDCTGIYSVPLLIFILLEFHSHGQLATVICFAQVLMMYIHLNALSSQNKTSVIYLFIRILTYMLIVVICSIHRYSKSTLHYRSYRLNVLFMCWFLGTS